MNTRRRSIMNFGFEVNMPGEDYNVIPWHFFSFPSQEEADGARTQILVQLGITERASGNWVVSEVHPIRVAPLLSEDEVSQIQNAWPGRFGK